MRMAVGLEGDRCMRDTPTVDWLIGRPMETIPLLSTTIFQERDENFGLFLYFTFAILKVISQVILLYKIVS